MTKKEVLEEAHFIESQIPNHPKWEKYEMLKKAIKCTEKQAEEAFKEVWDRIY